MKKTVIFIIVLLTGIQAISAQQNVISEEIIHVDWSGREAASVSDEVMQEIFSHLRRYEFYHIRFTTHPNSSTSFWTNRIVFQTRQNPSSSRIQMRFNYFSIYFHFSNEWLSFQGTDFSESWIWGMVAQNRFRLELNDVLNRTSLRMRGMTFGNNARYETDRRWLEALRLPLI